MARQIKPNLKYVRSEGELYGLNWKLPVFISLGAVGLAAICLSTNPNLSKRLEETCNKFKNYVVQAIDLKAAEGSYK